MDLISSRFPEEQIKNATLSDRALFIIGNELQHIRTSALPHLLHILNINPLPHRHHLLHGALHIFS